MISLTEIMKDLNSAVHASFEYILGLTLTNQNSILVVDIALSAE